MWGAVKVLFVSVRVCPCGGLVFLAVCLGCWGLLRSFACAALSVCVPAALAFPCFLIGLLALPLCGAALTFFAAAKKDKQRKRLTPLILKWVPWLG
ncbi:hypothetical protein PQQ96_35895, partial [Paraburkholderia sediminicola]|uniref:hypothetical protein n=1 Tax=Paraburkholderia sediminicola TaxID=458836 RepID=UPI0038BC3CF6